MPNKYKNGVFLARLQPLHNGHLYVINQMLSECDNSLLLIGSADKQGTTRNPFNIVFREMCATSLQLPKDKCTIYCINDLSNENDNNVLAWGDYLYEKISEQIECNSFTLYYSDDINIIKSWFRKELIQHITFEHINRDCVSDGVSATKVRSAILDNDIKYINLHCPNEVGKCFDYMRNELLKIREANHV